MPSTHNTLRCLLPVGLRGGHTPADRRVAPAELMFYGGNESNTTIVPLAYKRVNSYQ